MALRKVGPQGVYNIKTYGAEAPVQRGYGVKVGVADGNCLPVLAAGGRGIGISLADQAVVGGAVGVTRGGDTVAIAGSAATQGLYAKFDAAGRVVPVTGTPGGGEEVIGRFESSPTQLGDECIIFVRPFIL